MQLADVLQSERYELVYMGFALYVFDNKDKLYRNVQWHLEELVE
jgi:hypothetical protein